MSDKINSHNGVKAFVVQSHVDLINRITEDISIIEDEEFSKDSVLEVLSDKMDEAKSVLEYLGQQNVKPYIIMSNKEIIV